VGKTTSPFVEGGARSADRPIFEKQTLAIKKKTLMWKNRDGSGSASLPTNPVKDFAQSPKSPEGNKVKEIRQKFSTLMQAQRVPPERQATVLALGMNAAMQGVLLDLTAVMPDKALRRLGFQLDSTASDEERTAFLSKAVEQYLPGKGLMSLAGGYFEQFLREVAQGLQKEE